MPEIMSHKEWLELYAQYLIDREWYGQASAAVSVKMRKIVDGEIVVEESVSASQD